MEKTNVTAALPKIGGAVFMAPEGTTVPTSASAELDEAFVDLGYISEDGVTISKNLGGAKAWGGDVVLPNSAETAKMKFIELLNPNVLKLVNGSDNVSGALATGLTVQSNDDERDVVVLVVDMILRAGAVERLVFPRAQVESLADIVFKDSDAAGYEATIGCRKDGSGNSHYEYIQRAASGGNG